LREQIGADLRKLYQRRLKLTRDLAALNDSIQILERTSVYVAPLKVHHINGCGVGRRPAHVGGVYTMQRPYRLKSHLDANKKRTRDWSLVDCIACWKARKSQRPRRGAWIDGVMS
jgi:hypothetical protein